MLDAAGTGGGFIIALLMMGTVREVLGNGSFLGIPLFGAGFEPWIIMILPPGGFFTLGFLLLGFAWWEDRKRVPVRPRHWPHGVTAQVEAASAAGTEA
jgi:electron transport complex protein RnfE